MENCVVGNQRSKNGILFLLFCFLIVLSGCEKDENSYFELSTSKVNFTEKAESKTVEIHTNTDWQANISPSSAASWLTLSANRGGGRDVTLTLSATVNDEMEERSAEVSFNSDAGTKTISVVQQALTEYKDKYVKELQAAAKGKGINLVIMGDGFTKDDLAKGGFYEKSMKRAAEYFFSVEPYKSYREYFNVYMVVAESEEAGANRNDPFVKVNNKFNSTFGEGTKITCNEKLCEEYTALVPGMVMEKATDGNKYMTTEGLTILVINTSWFAGTTTMYSNGYSIALCPMATEYPSPNDFEGLIHHEAGGHGFGLFADEYVYFDEEIPAENMQTVQKWQKFSLGFYSNVDFTDDLTQIAWKDFIGRPNYSYVGAYEGAYMYGHGIWRPEYNTCMDRNIPYFSAPCRWFIVNRIMKLAGVSFTFSDFMSRDNVTPPAVTRSSVPGRTIPPLARPKMIEVPF